MEWSDGVYGVMDTANVPDYIPVESIIMEDPEWSNHNPILIRMSEMERAEEYTPSSIALSFLDALSSKNFKKNMAMSSNDFANFFFKNWRQLYDELEGDGKECLKP